MFMPAPPTTDLGVAGEKEYFARLLQLDGEDETGVVDRPI
jgi:hypothetical protein